MSGFRAFSLPMMAEKSVAPGGTVSVATTVRPAMFARLMPPQPTSIVCGVFSWMTATVLRRGMAPESMSALTIA